MNFITLFREAASPAGENTRNKTTSEQLTLAILKVILHHKKTLSVCTYTCAIYCIVIHLSPKCYGSEMHICKYMYIYYSTDTYCLFWDDKWVTYYIVDKYITSSMHVPVLE